VSGAPQTNWSQAVTRAGFTLLLVALVSYVVWWLLEPLLPILLALLALLGIYRLVLNGSRRDRW
jgi:predicted PurR-regulated permease PerM